jgi:hypothetical protein
MDIAVCVRRAVVKHEHRPPGAGTPNLSVKIDFFPARKRLRLVLCEIGLLRELRARQVDRLLQIEFFWLHAVVLLW